MALIPVDEQAEAALRFNDSLSNPTLAVSFSKEIAKHGKLLEYTNNTGAALPAGTVIEMGVVSHTLILPSSLVQHDALGAARTMDVGIQEYTKDDGSVEAADADALISALDVSAAGNTAMKDDTASLTNRNGLLIEGQTSILVTINGDTLQDGDGFTLHLDLAPYRG